MTTVTDIPRPTACLVAACTVHADWHRPVSGPRPVYAAASRVAS